MEHQASSIIKVTPSGQNIINFVLSPDGLESEGVESGLVVAVALEGLHQLHHPAPRRLALTIL
jgi:hypothetical protein